MTPDDEKTFKLMETINDLAEIMGWTCIAIPSQDEDDVEKCGIMIGTPEWIDEVLDGERDVVVMVKDVKQERH